MAAKGQRLAAWTVLEDCEEALHRLRSKESSPNWRISWVALVALLRAVGHVLKNVDVEVNDTARTMINSMWQRQRTEAIFRDFIDDERNNVLKAYTFGPDWRSDLRDCSGNVLLDISGSRLTVESESLKMQAGPFEGQDARDVAEQAIRWWKAQLEQIEEAL